jgi:hypothetical protein
LHAIFSYQHVRTRAGVDSSVWGNIGVGLVKQLRKAQGGTCDDGAAVQDISVGALEQLRIAQHGRGFGLAQAGAHSAGRGGREVAHNFSNISMYVPRQVQTVRGTGYNDDAQLQECQWERTRAGAHSSSWGSISVIMLRQLRIACVSAIEQLRTAWVGRAMMSSPLSVGANWNCFTHSLEACELGSPFWHVVLVHSHSVCERHNYQALCPALGLVLSSVPLELLLLSR